MSGTLTPQAAALVRKVTNPWLFGLWMLAKLPAALFAGVRLRTLDLERCQTSIPYGWRSTNPFRSTYFAAQAMAAELATGALVLLAAEEVGARRSGPAGRFSTLIVDMRATFGKKAGATVTFTCEGGAEALAACLEAQTTGEPRTVVLHAVGLLPDGVEASRFTFTWSVKARAR